MAKAIPSPFQTLWAESWELICFPNLKDKGVGALLAILNALHSWKSRDNQVFSGLGAIIGVRKSKTG